MFRRRGGEPQRGSWLLCAAKTSPASLGSGPSGSTMVVRPFVGAVQRSVQHRPAASDRPKLFWHSLRLRVGGKRLSDADRGGEGDGEARPVGRLWRLMWFAIRMLRTSPGASAPGSVGIVSFPPTEGRGIPHRGHRRRGLTPWPTSRRPLRGRCGSSRKPANAARTWRPGGRHRMSDLPVQGTRRSQLRRDGSPTCRTDSDRRISSP